MWPADPAPRAAMLPRPTQSPLFAVPIPQPDGGDGLLVAFLALYRQRGSQANGRPGNDNRSEFSRANSKRERDTRRILFFTNEPGMLLKTKENAKKTKLTAYPLLIQGDNLEHRTLLRQHSHSRKGPLSGLFRSIPGRSGVSYVQLCSSPSAWGHDGLHASMPQPLLSGCMERVSIRRLAKGPAGTLEHCL